MVFEFTIPSEKKVTTRFTWEEHLHVSIYTPNMIFLKIIQWFALWIKLKEFTVATRAASSTIWESFLRMVWRHNTTLLILDGGDISLVVVGRWPEIEHLTVSQNNEDLTESQTSRNISHPPEYRERPKLFYFWCSDGKRIYWLKLSF